MKRKDLVLRQLDRQLESCNTKQLARPKEGWIRTIRKALGMTGEQLAKRLGVGRSRILRIELDEQKDALTLRTLRETAEALNCELVYAIMPKKSLQSILHTQATKKAKDSLRRVSHSMKLEDQGVDQNLQQELEKELIESLLNGPLRHLWEEE